MLTDLDEFCERLPQKAAAQGVKMEKIQHPLERPGVPAEYLDALDRIDPLICSRERLVDLYRQAPDAEIRAFLVGILDVRTMVALITEKEF
jgi:hypothetical protein